MVRSDRGPPLIAFALLMIGFAVPGLVKMSSEATENGEPHCSTMKEASPCMLRCLDHSGFPYFVFKSFTVPIAWFGVLWVEDIGGLSQDYA